LPEQALASVDLTSPKWCRQDSVICFLLHYFFDLKHISKSSIIFNSSEHVSWRKKNKTCCRFSSSKSKTVVITFHISFQKNGIFMTQCGAVDKLVLRETWRKLQEHWEKKASKKSFFIL